MARPLGTPRHHGAWVPGTGILVVLGSSTMVIHCSALLESPCQQLGLHGCPAGFIKVHQSLLPPKTSHWSPSSRTATPLLTQWILETHPCYSQSTARVPAAPWAKCPGPPAVPSLCSEATQGNPGPPEACAETLLVRQ